MILQQGLTMDITTLEGPVRYGRGFAWWSDEDENPTHHLEESIATVIDALDQESYDLVVGHGQGAALTTSLLLENRISNHPKVGYVLNNPTELPEPTTLDVASSNLDDPSILMLTGMRDTVAPDGYAETIKETMSKAGATVKEIKHPKGHAIPIQNDETLRLTLEWIAENKKN